MPTDPYGLGRFRTQTGDQFTGVVIDEMVVPLHEIHLDAGDLACLLTDWPRYDKSLASAVARLTSWSQLARPVTDFTVLAPLMPTQIFQMSWSRA